ncbi:MAG: aggregation-promoting factor C-terminal-like domain-containing protein [Nocardioidaceae bacterium]
MPRRETYAPKHRGPASEPALKKGIKKSVLFSGVAVAATGIAVSSGIVLKSNAPGDAAAAALASAKADRTTPTNDAQQATAVRQQATRADRSMADRMQGTSRSDQRSMVDPRKATELNQDSGGMTTKVENLTSSDPRDIARAMLPQFGFSESEFSCLDSLYMSESGWRIDADNPTSSAYGIPQALPGSKMASAGPDWQTNPATQIRWGLQYIKSSYGTPCNAWAFKQSHNWY